MSLQTTSDGWRKKTTISKEIELLPSSKKTFAIYGETHNDLYNIFFDLKIGQQKIFTADVDVKKAYSPIRILYVAPKNYVNSSFLEPMLKQALSRRNEIEIEQITSESMPEHWIDYRNVDLVIINSDRPFLNFSNIEAKQPQSLLKWVKMGGHVLVSCGSEIWLPNNTFMHHLFNVDNIAIESTYSKELKNLTSCKSHYKFVHLNQTPIIEDLLWNHQHGYGRVTYLGADLKEYIDQKEVGRIWGTVLTKTSKYAVGYRSKDYVTRIFEQQRPKELIDRIGFTKDRAPILGLIITLMVIYIIIIGPVNFSWLRKRNKTIYLIFSIPIISLVFSFIVLFYGFFSKGITNIGKQVSFHYALTPGSYYTKDFLAISSGAKDSYTLKGQDSTIVTKLNFQHSEETLKYRQGNGIEVANYPINLWETKFFRLETVTSNQPFTAHRTKSQLIIKKPQDWKVTNAYFVNHTQRALYKIDKFDGSPIPIDLQTKSYSLNSYGYNNTFWRDKQIPHHLARLISVELKDYMQCDDRDFVIAFIQKDLVDLSTTPNINVKEHINILVTPVTRKN